MTLPRLRPLAACHRWFLIVVAALFAMLWLGQIAGAITTGRLPTSVSDLGLPTSSVYQTRSRIRGAAHRAGGRLADPARSSWGRQRGGRPRIPGPSRAVRPCHLRLRGCRGCRCRHCSRSYLRSGHGHGRAVSGFGRAHLPSRDCLIARPSEARTVRAPSTAGALPEIEEPDGRMSRPSGSAVSDAGARPPAGRRPASRR